MLRAWAFRWVSRTGKEESMGSRSAREVLPGPKRSSRRLGETLAWSHRRQVWPSSTRYAPPFSIREKEARMVGGRTRWPVWREGKPLSGLRVWRAIIRGYSMRESSRAPMDFMRRMTWVLRSEGSWPAVSRRGGGGQENE